MDEKTVQLKLLGKVFVCTVCAHDQFWQQGAELKEPGASLFKVKKNAVVLICSKCGYVHWFKPEMGSFKPQSETEE